MPRTIAIGNTHGCSESLASILQAIDPQPDGTIVTLGDYVNRGIDSEGVLDMLIELSKNCRTTRTLGNPCTHGSRLCDLKYSLIATASLWS
jgi:serine/threonine protein phosphatase 1